MDVKDRVDSGLGDKAFKKTWVLRATAKMEDKVRSRLVLDVTTLEPLSGKVRRSWSGERSPSP